MLPDAHQIMLLGKIHFHLKCFHCLPSWPCTMQQLFQSSFQEFKSVTTTSKLRTGHQARHQPLQKRTFFCNECEFCSQSEASLDKHNQRHLQKSAFQCKLCSYSVGSAGKLNNHLQLDHSKKSGIRKTHNTSLQTSPPYTIPPIPRVVRPSASERATGSQRPLNIQSGSNGSAVSLNPAMEDQPMTSLGNVQNPLKRKFRVNDEVKLFFKFIIPSSFHKHFCFLLFSRNPIWAR